MKLSVNMQNLLFIIEKNVPVTSPWKSPVRGFNSCTPVKLSHYVSTFHTVTLFSRIPQRPAHDVLWVSGDKQSCHLQRMEPSQPVFTAVPALSLGNKGKQGSLITRCLCFLVCLRAIKGERKPISGSHEMGFCCITPNKEMENKMKVFKGDVLNSE